MKPLLLGSVLAFFCILILPLLTTSCAVGNLQNCYRYKYDAEQQIWVDSQGIPVACTIADNETIFQFYPEKGCEYWAELFQADPTASFLELIIKYKGGAQKYCVKQHVLELDNTDEVLILKGSLCLQAGPNYAQNKNEFVFTDCNTVERKNPATDSN